MVCVGNFRLEWRGRVCAGAAIVYVTTDSDCREDKYLVHSGSAQTDLICVIVMYLRTHQRTEKRDIHKNNGP